MDVTVVVPTRNESGNVRELLSRLDNALGALSAEVLFVDDSDDETPAVISAARHWYPRPVRLLHREIGHRDGGLGGAVVAGFRWARAPWVVVIDGDLQHPPEVIPRLLERGSAEQLDLVAASRYQESGDAGGLDGRWRAAVSALCTFVAKMLFPRRLRGVSDPMSGFFAVRLAALNLAALRPVGYKVLLEILARCALPNRADVPYAFQPRFTGRSKASVKQGLHFFQHLYLLRMKASWEGMRAFVAFMAVGLTGVAVNTLVLWLLSASWLRLPYLLASAISTQIAIVWNFTLIEHLVFRRAHARSVAGRLLRFWLVNVGLLPVQLGLLAFCVEALGWPPVSANLVVLAIVFGLRYAVCSGWVYRRSPVGPTNVLTQPEPVSERSGPEADRGRSVVSYAVRLCLPLLLTAAAFPQRAVMRWGADVPGRWNVWPVTVLAAGLVVWTLAATPRPREPDVHDRQLDVILGLPLIAAAVWLSAGWGRPGPAGDTLTDREVIAVTVFLFGATLLLLGTRVAARLRWAVLLPLVGMPTITGHPALVAMLSVGIAGAALAMLAMHAIRLRRQRIGTAETSADPTGRLQTLPPLGLAVGIVAAVALVLGVRSFGFGHETRQQSRAVQQEQSLPGAHL